MALRTLREYELIVRVQYRGMVLGLHAQKGFHHLGTIEHHVALLFAVPPTSIPNRFNFSKYFCTRLATCLAVRRPPMACEIRDHLRDTYVSIATGSTAC